MTVAAFEASPQVRVAGWHATMLVRQADPSRFRLRTEQSARPANDPVIDLPVLWIRGLRG